MTSDLRISVAMATCNGARFLAEQLDSIAAQTLLPHEIVLSDDASDDATEAVARAFAERQHVRMRILRNDRRRGVGENFMHAACRCEGELVAFADQDDVWRSDKLARCAAPFADAAVQLVVHGYAVADEALRVLGREQPAIRETRLLEPLELHPWAQFPGMAMVFRRGLLEAFDWEDRPRAHEAGRRLIHDEWVIGVARLLGRIVLLPYPLVVYRQHRRNVEGAPDRRLRGRLHDLATDSSAYYLRRAGQAEDWARLLEAKADAHDDAQLAGRLAREARAYRALAAAVGARSRVHDPASSASARLSGLHAALSVGAYRRRSHGGFGLRGLGRDAALVVAALVRPRPASVP